VDAKGCSDGHMVLRPGDIQAMRSKLLVDLVEQPVASSEPTDENDMLEMQVESSRYRVAKETKATHRYRFVSHLALL